MVFAKTSILIDTLAVYFNWKIRYPLGI